MVSTKVLLLQLLLLSVLSVLSVLSTESDQHLGTSSTFAYKGEDPDGTYSVLFRNRISSGNCKPPSTWKCIFGRCGDISSAKNLKTFSSNNGPEVQKSYCEAETLVLRTVPRREGFGLRARECCWINQSLDWWAVTGVDVGERADTGEANRSPVFSALPFFRVPKNCPRTYNLVPFDPDGDSVKCNKYELKEEPAGFHLDKDSCTLHYDSAETGLKRFDIVVEDFPAEKSVIVTSLEGRISVKSQRFSFSRLPLHFSLQVEDDAPKCEEGLYIPKFVDPTPEDGEMIYAVIEKVMKITVKAEASGAKVIGLVFSGPFNSSLFHRRSNEFVISWTPTADEADEYIPICFAAESRLNEAIYQSVMRCVVVKVKKPKVPPKSHVICNESSMTILVEKATLPPVNEDDLQLNDPSNTDCSLKSNSTHIFCVVPLSQCGTQIKEDDDNLVFTNEITTSEGTNDMITRKNLLEVEFSCKYPKRGNVSQNFLVHRKNITVFEKGMGEFTYTFEFYEDDSYQDMIDPESYPLEVTMESKLFMKIEATSSLDNTELFVESCRASPYDNPNYHKTYSIIADGCNVDPTVNVYPIANKNHFEFSMEAFKFIGTYEQVYISCSVIMCEAGNLNTRCSQGCMKSPSSPLFVKRETAIQSGKHSVSQGPLRLKRSAENSNSSAIALNLAFIAGCVLAAAGMILGVVMYKAKASKI